jgi:glycolate oxidase
VDPRDADGAHRTELDAQELFVAAGRMQGSISGEHGFGFVRRGHLDQQWSGAAVDLHHGIKRAFDPHDLINPGKKI